MAYNIKSYQNIELFLRVAIIAIIGRSLKYLVFHLSVLLIFSTARARSVLEPTAGNHIPLQANYRRLLHNLSRKFIKLWKLAYLDLSYKYRNNCRKKMNLTIQKMVWHVYCTGFHSFLIVSLCFASSDFVSAISSVLASFAGWSSVLCVALRFRMVVNFTEHFVNWNVENYIRDYFTLSSKWLSRCERCSLTDSLPAEAAVRLSRDCSETDWRRLADSEPLDEPWLSGSMDASCNVTTLSLEPLSLSSVNASR